jgi:hypothetical protein
VRIVDSSPGDDVEAAMVATLASCIHALGIRKPACSGMALVLILAGSARIGCLRGRCPARGTQQVGGASECVLRQQRSLAGALPAFLVWLTGPWLSLRLGLLSKADVSCQWAMCGSLSASRAGPSRPVAEQEWKRSTIPLIRRAMG